MTFFKTLLAHLLVLISLTLGHSQNEKWYPTKSPQSPVYCFASIDDYLYAGVGNVGVIRTNDKGETWDTLRNGLRGLYPSSILSLGDDTLLVSTHYNGVFKSINSGEEWREISAGLDVDIVTSLARRGALVFAGTSQGVFRMNTKEEIWERVNLPKGSPSNQYINCLFVEGNLILAGGTENLYISKDAGQSWEALEGVTNFNITAIEKNRGKYLIATSGDGILELSASFRSVNPSNEFLGENQATYVTALFTTNAKQLLKGTSNRGVINDSRVFNDGLGDFEIRSLIEHKGVLYAGTFRDGIMVFDSRLEELTSLQVNQPNQIAAELAVIPNPAIDLITVSYSLETENTPVSIRIFAKNGRLVKTVLSEEIHNSGQYAMRVELKTVPAGVYFCTLTTNNGQLTKQFLIKE